MNKFWYLGIGGVAGTLARYALSGFIQRFTRADFPFGTLGVNLAGCFIVGFLAAVPGERFLLTPNTRLLLVTGFCGAFTTFSAMILETAHLIQTGQASRAVFYIGASIAAGLLFFRGGIFMGELL